MNTTLRKSAHQIIENLPDDKVAYVIAILRGIQGLNIPEEEPDDIDLQLIREAMEDNDEETSLDDFARELGFNVDELRS